MCIGFRVSNALFTMIVMKYSDTEGHVRFDNLVSCYFKLMIVFGEFIDRSFIHSFILAISIAPLQVLYFSEALPTTARILYRSFTPKRTGNCR